MQFEDFSTAKFLVEQINKKNVFLEDLDNVDLRLVITANQSGHKTLTTIGVGSTEHEFGHLAKDFIEMVKMNTKKDIKKLHEKLEAL
jgi:type IV secretory pathway ATPase VirB11/archaellum biosynthesis ATPase